jgi:hypothetical protein
MHSLKERGPDYLTEDSLIEAHGRCGALMHSANPYGLPIDYAFYQKSFNIWLPKIMNLLNNHKVHLLGDTGFYLFHMKETGDDEVHWYRFDPRNLPSEGSSA